MIIVGIVLYAYGKLPQPFAVIASSYVTLITLVTVLWERLGPPLIKTWQASYQVHVMCASIVTVALLTGGTLLYSNGGYSSLFKVNITGSSNSRPPLAIIPTQRVPVNANILLNQKIPFCSNPQGTNWKIPFQGTILSCEKSDIMMQQSLTSHYAELDLDQVEGKPYSQISFQVQVKVTFKNARDLTTWAGLFIQIPETPGEKYVLALNTQGQWQLQYGADNGRISILDQGGQIDITPSEPTMLAVKIQNGVLYALINGQYVDSYGVGLVLHPLPNLVGLRVEQTTMAMSSRVLFSDFKLERI